VPDFIHQTIVTHSIHDTSRTHLSCCSRYIFNPYLSSIILFGYKKSLPYSCFSLLALSLIHNLPESELSLDLRSVDRRFPDLQPLLSDVKSDPLSDLFGPGFGFGVEPAL
jgi:hypothetical protein